MVLKSRVHYVEILLTLSRPLDVQSECAEKRHWTYRYVDRNIGIQSVTVDIW